MPWQFDKSIELGVAAYQEKHNLLTAAQIKAKRKGLGWSQQELADRANVGIASIKRWERGRQVQTAANDNTLQSTFSFGNQEGDLVFVSVTQTRFFTIGEMRSFSPNRPANPMVYKIKQSPLRSNTLGWGISDHPFNEECYA